MPRILLVLLLLAAPLTAQAPSQAEFDELKRKNAELEKRLEKLEKQGGNEAGADELDKAVAEAEAGEKKPDSRAQARESRGRELFGFDLGSARVRLIDISLTGLFAVGYSSVKDRFTEGLNGGGHDPKRRGFTLQQIELSFSGAVDPYFRAEAHFVVGEEGFELEETFFQTLSLPAGLQLEGGYFLTEFGRVNPRHPHDWDFIDQPVINTRIMGPDGMRGLGARLGWLTPLPWFSEVHVGVQNGNDESMVSFLGEGHHHGGEEHSEESLGGFARVERDIESLYEFVYLWRWHNHFSIGSNAGFSVGVSGLFGPNATGDKGKTWVGGADMLFKWRPSNHQRGWPYLRVQGEFMYRYFKADRGVLEEDPADPLDDIFLDSTVLGDWGGYLQVMLGFAHGWSAGLRLDFADAFREGEELRKDDPLRDRRWRASALVEWRITEFARMRIQYNLDHMEHLKHSTAHGFWLSFEFLIGAHPAHGY